MTAESNEALVCRLYDAVWSSDDFDVADGLIAKDEVHPRTAALSLVDRRSRSRPRVRFVLPSQTPASR